MSWADFVKPKAQLVAMSGSSTGLNITCTPQAVADRSFQFTSDMTVQLPLSCIAMGRTVYKLDTSFLSDRTGRYTDAWNIHCVSCPSSIAIIHQRRLLTRARVGVAGCVEGGVLCRRGQGRQARSHMRKHKGGENT